MSETPCHAALGRCCDYWKQTDGLYRCCYCSRLSLRSALIDWARCCGVLSDAGAVDGIDAQDARADLGDESDLVQRAPGGSTPAGRRVGTKRASPGPTQRGNRLSSS